ncbi:MAG: hypothetical protein HOP17_16990 [Acidobacteria bacterium]|nr:hypothetical protein [Acidobacteriota bacterium]
MKKFLVGALLLFVFAITLPVLSYAQSCRLRNNRGRSAGYSYSDYGYNTRRNYNRRNYDRGYDRGYYQPAYYQAPRRSYYQPSGYYYGSNRSSFYRRHRNVINVGLGTGGGALIGGLLGGRRGAVIGALAGAGGSALYTYKLRPKQRRYYNYYR